MSRRMDLKNLKFNKLTVSNYVFSKNGNSHWECKCDCGSKIIVAGCHLKSGHTTSCGCNQISAASEVKKTHGLTKHRLYKIWSKIKERCFNKKSKHYQDYGGRGIKICNEWVNSFQTFYNWAITNGYEDNLSIDRIDNNGNYESLNCRWVIDIVQCNNRRSNVYYTHNNEIKTLAEWARFFKIKYSIAASRRQRGMNFEELFQLAMR